MDGVCGNQYMVGSTGPPKSIVQEAGGLHMAFHGGVPAGSLVGSWWRVNRSIKELTQKDITGQDTNTCVI